jgi:hypothetical protein
MPGPPADQEGSLFERVSALIERARQIVCSPTNLVATVTFWRIGHLIDLEILGQQRADYGKEIFVSLGRELTAGYAKDGIAAAQLGHSGTNVTRQHYIAKAHQAPDLSGVLQRVARPTAPEPIRL